ncbi:MAG TPA: glycosyltransferase family 25 protein [Gemmatimonadales bacterium]|nr:glycosyltransferase family 25 protein [Gemmatimonadales bacterium]
MRTSTVVISLPEATERRAVFSARAAKTSLAWRWFDARRDLGPDLEHDPDEAIVAKGRPMYPGELGCYASHHAAWTDFLEGDADQLLVLEDDTIVDWGFLESLAGVDLDAAGLAYLRLYAKRPCPFRVLVRNAIARQRSLVEFLDRPLGTQGYVLTRAGARRLVPHCRRVLRPIDDELDRAWDHGIRTLCVFPFPVIEESSASSIDAARWDPYVMPGRLRLRRYRTRLTERALKLRRSFRRLADRSGNRLRTLAVA